MTKKHAILIALFGAATAILLCACVSGLLRNLGPLVTALGPILGLNKSETANFSAIFGQLSDAVIRPPKLIAMITGFGSVWLLLSVKKPKSTFLRVLLRILLFTVLFAAAFCITLFLTDVNTIRFGSVLLSLLGIIKEVL